jgi:hypothetical protein
MGLFYPFYVLCNLLSVIKPQHPVILLKMALPFMVGKNAENWGVSVRRRDTLTPQFSGLIPLNLEDLLLLDVCSNAMIGKGLLSGRKRGGGP